MIDNAGYWRVPYWARNLSQFYVRLRRVRAYQQSERRLWYRYIAIEKAFLIENGVDDEYLRLICLHLSDPARQSRVDRLVEVETALENHSAACGVPLPWADFQGRSVTVWRDWPKEFRRNRSVTTRAV